jgi:mRNA-degrading endonuclease RelE of RelBE toxin-antitoxin system
MTWRLVVAKRASRELERASERDATRLLKALEEMAADPFSGDIVRLKGGGSREFRRRVGSWRILYALDVVTRTVEVTDILRRTSSTY